MSSEAGALKLVPLKAMDRVERTGSLKSGPAIRLTGARRETEPFQFAVAARGSRLDRVRVAASDLIGNDGARISKAAIQIFREHEIAFEIGSPGAPVPPGSYFDALIPIHDPYTGLDPDDVPYDGQPFSVPAGSNQPIWVDVRIPIDAQAGNYKGTIKVTTASAGSASISYELKVWDFEIPLTPALATSFGDYRIGRYYGFDYGTDAYFQIHRRYADSLLDHRMAAVRPADMEIGCSDDGHLRFPKDVGGLGSAREIFNYYMTTRGASAVTLPIWENWPFSDPLGADRDETIAYIRNFMGFAEKGGWDDRVYIYIIDEPNSAAAYNEVRQWGRLFNEAGEEVRLMMTEQPKPDNPAWGSLVGYVDIWCPLSSSLTRSQAEERLAAGEEIWTYTALVQDDISPKWLLDHYPIEYRMYPWISPNYGITGLLYWETTYWEESPDPWTHASAYDRRYVGEGQLFYPGTIATVGFDGPVASMRIRWIREGIDDYDYVALLKSLGDDAFATDCVKRVASSWKNWTRDPDLLLEQRRRMGERIEALMIAKRQRP